MRWRNRRTYPRTYVFYIFSWNIFISFQICLKLFSLTKKYNNYLLNQKPDVVKKENILGSTKHFMNVRFRKSTKRLTEMFYSKKFFFFRKLHNFSRKLYVKKGTDCFLSYKRSRYSQP